MVLLCIWLNRGDVVCKGSLCVTELKLCIGYKTGIILTTSVNGEVHFNTKEYFYNFNATPALQHSAFLSKEATHFNVSHRINNKCHGHLSEHGAGKYPITLTSPTSFINSECLN